MRHEVVEMRASRQCRRIQCQLGLLIACHRRNKHSSIIKMVTTFSTNFGASAWPLKAVEQVLVDRHHGLTFGKLILKESDSTTNLKSALFYAFRIDLFRLCLGVVVKLLTRSFLQQEQRSGVKPFSISIDQRPSLRRAFVMSFKH